MLDRFNLANFYGFSGKKTPTYLDTLRLLSRLITHVTWFYTSGSLIKRIRMTRIPPIFITGQLLTSAWRLTTLRIVNFFFFTEMDRRCRKNTLILKKKKRPRTDFKGLIDDRYHYSHQVGHFDMIQWLGKLVLLDQLRLNSSILTVCPYTLATKSHHYQNQVL